jgi:hypothetical protein
VTLIVIGTRRSIKRAFRGAGWYQAVPVGFVSSFRSVLSTILSRSYKQGPMWPVFVDGKHHQIGFERPTKSDTFQRRHHLRLWRTKFTSSAGRVWVGTLSYDSRTGVVPGTLRPTHHISPGLNIEENFLARTFGIKEPRFIKLSEPESGVIGTGDDYIWDGMALVISSGRQ